MSDIMIKLGDDILFEGTIADFPQDMRDQAAIWGFNKKFANALIGNDRALLPQGEEESNDAYRKRFKAKLESDPKAAKAYLDSCRASVLDAVAAVKAGDWTVRKAGGAPRIDDLTREANRLARAWLKGASAKAWKQFQDSDNDAKAKALAAIHAKHPEFMVQAQAALDAVKSASTDGDDLADLFA